MRKRLEDLSDAPLHDGVTLPRNPDEARRMSDAVETILDDIRRMRDSDNYRFADDTLRGIAESVERTGVVTPRQRQSVTNISESRRAPYGGWGRRYEGY